MNVAINRCHHLEYLCITKKPSNNQTSAPSSNKRAMVLLKNGIRNPGAIETVNAVNGMGQRLQQAVLMTSFWIMSSKSYD
jgi:hypothetical protein